MKTIGQFAKANNVTVKTLHHYEKLDLINPTKVDDNTGYRYYSDEARVHLHTILFLKDLGFSLSEIKEVMQSHYDVATLLEFIEFKKKQATQDMNTTSDRLHKLDTMETILKQTDGKNQIKELIEMSEDALFTGNYGRGDFIEAAEKTFNKAKQEKTPLSIIQMDLDHFHQVNKTYGYDIGDIVLQRTQDEIMSVLQASKHETLLQRKGGDEFTVLVNCTGLAVSKLTTNILNAVVNVDYSDVAENLSVSITAGIASMTRKNKSYADLMHEATIKLYESKRNRH